MSGTWILRFSKTGSVIESINTSKQILKDDNRQLKLKYSYKIISILPEGHKKCFFGTIHHFQKFCLLFSHANLSNQANQVSQINKIMEANQALMANQTNQTNHNTQANQDS